MKKTVETTGKKSIYEKSFFMNLIYRVTTWFYALMINGIFGRFFTAYSDVENCFEQSKIFRKLNGLALFRKIGSKIKLGTSRAFENSRIVTVVSDMLTRTLKCHLKTYGAAFAVTGAVGLLIYTLEGGSFYVFFREPSSIISCVSFIVIGMFFMTSKKLMSEALYESHIMSGLLFEGFGIQKDFFAYEESEFKGYLVPVIIGSIFGMLSYFVNPTYYIIGLVIAICATMIIVFPELGVLALLALIPLAAYLPHPTVLLYLVVIFTSTSYVIKLVRGKRMIRFRLIDICIMAFLLLRFMSGICSAGGSLSLHQAVLHSGLILAYFLGVNLIRNKEWLKRAVVTFILFASVSLVIGVFQMFVGGFESGWIDSASFSEITVRVTSTFENPNNFAAYLLLLIPFAICKLLESKNTRSLTFYGITTVFALACMLQTWSRGAWLGLCVSIVVFFLVYSRKSLPYVVAGGAVGAIGISLLAPTVSSRFLSIGNLSESSVSYRISAWKGIVEMLNSYGWMPGIGYGEASFAALYPAFAYSGASAVKHAHSLYLQLLLEMGIPGLLLFVIIIILFVQNCFEYLYRLKNAEGKRIAVAGIAAVAGFLVMGLTDYVWYNSRVYLMFWLVLAMVDADIRIGFVERNREAQSVKGSSYSANLEIDPESLY